MRDLVRDRRGIAAVECALALSFLFFLLLGFIDVVQVGRGHLRAQSAASQIGQVVSQCRRVSGGDEGGLSSLTQELLGSFGRPGSWTVVINAIGRDAQGNNFTWQMPQARPAMASASLGNTPPAGLTLAAGQVVFRTEVFVSVNTTFFSRSRFGARAPSNAYGSALHMTRVPDVSGLTSPNRAKTQVECLA